MIRYLALGLSIVSATVSHARAEPPSITGITLGMTLEELKEKIGPDFTLKASRKSDDGVQQEWFALKPFEGYAIVILSGKLIYLDHYQSFTEETKPSSASVGAALLAKYGPVSIAHQPNFFFWAYDAGGLALHNIPQANNLRLLACASNTSSTSPQLPPNPDKTPYSGAGSHMELFVPISADPNCPVVVQANVSVLDIYKYYNVIMQDQRPLFEYISGVKARKENERKSQEESNKPKL